jgi:hypothetical protein
MLNRYFGTSIHAHIHFVGVIAFAIGLPSSKFILSLATILLFTNIVVEGNWKEYWRNCKTTKLYVPIFLFWMLHILGLAWTTDFQYAFKDNIIKLTLFVIPFILVAKPIQSLRQINTIWLVFCGTLALTSVVNFAAYQQWFGPKIYLDIRELSLFGSHIRYGILLSFGAILSLYLLIQLKHPAKWLFVPVFAWFCFYTYYSQIISGLLALIVGLFCFVFFYAYAKAKKTTILLSISAGILSVLFLVYFIREAKKDYIVAEKELPTHTPMGNAYTHNLDKGTFIDGQAPLTFVCEHELERAWKSKSNIPYTGKDAKNQPLRYTLIRYMTSKSLRKDGTDFALLSKQDIANIERGIASYQETKTGFSARVEGLKFQLQHHSNPNGHSMLQRIEFWKTAWFIIQNNWLIGVGTGDVQAAFTDSYAKRKSRLKPENQLRAHNSYLTSWLTFGLAGIAIFSWMNFTYLKTQWREKNLLGVTFISIAIVTFLLEDTLETQMGVSFYAFFYALFIQKATKNE